MRYEIRELGLGEILDQAIAVLKDHWKLLLGITLVLLVPFMVVQGLVTLSVTPELPPNPTPQDVMAAQKAVVANLPMVLPVVLLGALFVLPITNAAIICAIASVYLGKPITVGESFQRAFSLTLPLIWTWFLFYLAVMGGTILCVIPGILCMFWFALATQVVVIEGTSGIEALKRSRELMRGNIGTLFALLLLIGAINAGISIAGSIIPQEHVRVIGSALAQAVASIFAAAAVVVFYFSCRAKNEHFDLTLLAQGVGAEVPETSAGEGDAGMQGFGQDDFTGQR